MISLAIIRKYLSLILIFTTFFMFSQSVEVESHSNNSSKVKIDYLYQLYQQQIRQRDYNNAIITGNQLLEEVHNEYGDLSYEFCNIAIDLANLYSAIGNYENTIICLEIALVNLLEMNDGSYTKQTAIILDNLSKYHSQIGEYEKGYDRSIIAIEKWKEISGTKSVDYVIALSNCAQNAIGLGKLTEAIQLTEKGLEILDSINDNKSAQYASLLDNLASYCKKNGDLEKALSCNLRSYDIFKELRYQRPWDYAICSYNLGGLFMVMEQYNDAVKYFCEVIETCKQLDVENSSLCIEALYGNMISFQQLGEFEKALGVCNTIYNIYKEEDNLQLYDLEITLASLMATTGKNIKEIETILNNFEKRINDLFKNKLQDYIEGLIHISRIYGKIGNDLKSQEYFDKVINILLDGIPNQTIIIYDYLFNVYYEADDLERSLDIAYKMMELIENNKNLEITPKLITTVSLICKLCDKSTHYDKATEYGNIWLRLLEQTETSDFEKSVALNWNATFNSHKGDYYKAIEYSEKSIDLATKVLYNPENPSWEFSIARIYNNLGKYYNMVGNTKKAIEYSEKSIELEKTYNPNPEDLATNMGTLAVAYAHSGNISKAIQLIEQAIMILDNNEIASMETYPTLLMNLGKYYSYIGNNKSALEVLLKAYSLQAEELGESNSETLMTLSNLAQLALKNGNFELAASWLTMAIEDMKNVWGEDNIIYICTLSDFALCCKLLKLEGYEEKVIKIQKKVVDLTKQNLGEKSLHLITSMYNLACYYLEENNIIEGIKTAEEAMDLQLELYGKNNLESLSMISDLLSFKIRNNIELSNKDYNILNDYYISLINSFKLQLSSMREEIRNQYWVRNNELGNILMLMSEIIKDEKIQSVYTKASFDYALIRKGLLISASKEFNNVVNKDFTDINILKSEIDSLYAVYNNLVSKTGEGFENYLSNEKEIDKIRTEIKVKENIIIEQVNKYTNFVSQMDWNYGLIQNKLKPDDLAIEFVKYLDKNNTRRYAALILNCRDSVPAFIPLCSETELLNVSKNQNERDKKLTNYIWLPLKAYLGEIKNIYFSPDGDLHQIAIEYLPDFEDEGKLMSDRYNLYRLSSTRQLAMRKESSPSRSATLYGGIEYNTEPSEMKKESDRYRSGIRGSEMSGIEDATMERALDETDRGTVAPLSYTWPEVKGIDSLLTDKGYSTRLYSGKEASEESFKTLSGQGSGILHIATHGRYLKEDEAEKEVARNHRLMFMSQDRDMMTRHVEDKALTRSWLYMSGANRTLKREPLDEGVDNGILTAQEISQMDLRGTDLVVLSACQTGLGDIGSDGVFGLQRGFKKAGANTILMSLWKVDDEATQILMTEFYKNYLDGMSKQQSLQAAQKILRENPEYSAPEYWAAFILLDALN